MGSALLDRMSKLFTAAPVLAALPGTWVVGGAVRDLMLGSAPGDFDVVVEGDAIAVARCGRGGAARRGGRPRPVRHRHRAGRRARVRRRGRAAGDLPAAGRAAGCLPRREHRGRPRAARLHRQHARAAAGGRAGDGLAGGGGGPRSRVLRVLHDRSFVDDPTRLVRMARYAGRLGFPVEPGNGGARGRRGRWAAHSGP